MSTPGPDEPSSNPVPDPAGGIQPPRVPLANDLADLPLAIPRVLGDFRLIREVGRGGMGVVFEAIDQSLGRRVALKVLPIAAMLQSQHFDRFQLEAQVLARLRHPNLLPIYSVGRDAGISFLVMPLIEGRDLAEMIKEMARPRPLGATRSGPEDSPAGGEGAAPAGAGGDLVAAAADPKRQGEFFRAVARLGFQAASALAHSHDAGVWHRDIKPANLIVEPTGQLWVTDFGLARFLEDGDLTRSGDLIGTIRYMSPEQAAGRRDLIDGRTDVYSLGMTLHETLTHRPAFPGLDGEPLIRKMAFDDPPALRTINPLIPVDLETIVIRATARSPADRYPTATALADDLRRFASDLPIQARRPSPRERFARWAVRPERTDEAAHSLFWFGVLLTVINVATLLGFGFGVVRPASRTRFLGELAIGLVVFDLPPVWAGVWALRGRRAGLILGALTTVHFLALILASSLGIIVISYGGITEELSERWSYMLIFGMMGSYTLARIVLGLIASRPLRSPAMTPGGPGSPTSGKN